MKQCKACKKEIDVNNNNICYDCQKEYDNTTKILRG